MTHEEYILAINQKRAQIRDLKKQIYQLTEQYCEQNSPFKIGDKIRLGDKEGVISFVGLDFLESGFMYKWTPIKKNGKFDYEQRIYSYEIPHIEKI